MGLAISFPFPPMEAKSSTQIPRGDQWEYEPKWDGFRCLVFKDGGRVELQSKSSQPLGRYFPELVETIRKIKARQFVVDGEIVIPEGKGFSFDHLLLRIHPAQSRVELLSKQTPAKLVLFDLLVDEKNRSLVEAPLQNRRAHLQKFADKYLSKTDSLILSPFTRDIKKARRWLTERGTRLDGIVAKRLDLPYLSGERAMQKIKRLRTADCVVGGFRYSSKEKTVGSLLLGLYDADGLLNHVGFTSSFTPQQRRELVKKLVALIKPPGFTGHAPGGPSRWATARSAEWHPLSPRLVVEVQYDHFSGGRFRHGTKFLRWRPDKKPSQCTFDQLSE